MKKLLALFLALMAFVNLAACGAKEEAPADIDVAALAKELFEADIYDDIISEIPLQAAPVFYGYEEGQVLACALYQSTAAAAEEIFVAQCADAAAAETVKAGAEARIQSQIAAYENYVPAEIPKLEAAILEVAGNYVIFSVSADAAAAQAIIDSHLGR